MSVYIAARTTVTDKEKYENEFLPAVMKVHEAHARALFEEVKPLMAAMQCTTNPRISIVPGIPVAAAAAAE